MDIIKTLTEELKLQPWQVENTVALLDEGNTIPFIARYRKEAHGTLDDQTIRSLSERLEYLRNLDKRREEITSSITEQGKMTGELQTAIDGAKTLAELEDLYRPYKQKRRTRASVAKEKGLEPLADEIFQETYREKTLAEAAQAFVDPEKGVETVEQALAGASDILAERFSDRADLRKRLKEEYLRRATVVSKQAKDEDSVYAQYYEFAERAGKIASHRVLALDRGEKEGFLKVSVAFDRERALDLCDETGGKMRKERGLPVEFRSNKADNFVLDAEEDAYDRLIRPSIEREIRSMLTERAATEAIGLFAQNLRPLLLAPPVKNKIVLALDPGYRNGCKCAVVDGTGKVLDTGIIYVTMGDRRYQEAKHQVKTWISKYGVQVLSIGNGTASKETELFAVEVIKEVPQDVSYMVVNEAGASIYSASKLAAEEFPQYDVSIRSAVSIARRLQDPLAELVKIDPESIGVGQYQHDMPKKQLSAALDGVVEDCVNSVGADLNTASAPLLSHIAGISKTVAKNIVTYREENGAFTGRAQLKKVPKLGPKAYEQCAGFLRVPESRNILDNTGVHPESYAAAKALLEKCGYTTADVKKGNLNELHTRIESVGYSELSKELGVGVPTLQDMERELTLPGRDPRDELPPPLLRTDVMGMEDLKEGMELKGTVRNVIDFGAFVDIGVHQDGLVHISELSDHYVKHPSELLSVGDVVTVRVLSVDLKKKRISLSMKGVAQQ
ncbi:MAG: RNA-binding transcriptional accessory protein [Clostridia bacterium]|nr:RNA-binding transcriptional accessory protein [Clostridia bacterium]